MYRIQKQSITIKSKKMATTKFKTGAGSNWDTSKPVRTSMFVPNKELDYFPICRLTGKFEDHPQPDGTIDSMVEVETQYDNPVMIWEQFVS